MNNDNLSINNMVEFAMGLSMSSLFAQAMNNSFNNSLRVLDNSQLNVLPKYIYVIVNGAQRGPLSLPEFTDMIKSGSVTPQTYIWKAGMSEWLRAQEVPDVMPNAEALPPEFNK